MDADAAAPTGWNAGLGAQLQAVTVPGFSVFARDDLLRAATILLASAHAVRIKLADGIGGGGQCVVRDLEACRQHLATLTPADLDAGVVVEVDMAQPATYSVGEMRLGGRRIAYVGTQGLGRDRQGRPVYGGSTLSVVRGGLSDLLDVFRQPRLRRTVEMAITYDRCAQAAYPQLQCSRRNYDVLWGSDAHGRALGGVLEQSWRVGGATPAELAAFDLLDREPGIAREVYAVRGTVRPGNSGGPLLSEDGQVVGTVFAMSLVDPETGYALTDAATAAWLDSAAALTEPVPTGACMTS